MLYFEKTVLIISEVGAVPPPKEGQQASKQRFVLAVKSKERSAVPGSTRFVDAEAKMKTDLVLVPGTYECTVAVTAWSVGGQTGLSAVVVEANPIATKK